MIKIYTSIEQQLKDNYFNRIIKFSDFLIYFDVDNLDEDKCPKIITDKKTIIVFDNQKYNETYLIDLIIEHGEKNPSIKACELVYCDNPDIRRQLFCPAIVENDYKTVDMLERDFLLPTIMIINPIENQLTFFQESIIPFDSASVENIFTWLKL